MKSEGSEELKVKGIVDGKKWLTHCQSESLFSSVWKIGRPQNQLSFGKCKSLGEESLLSLAFPRLTCIGS